ncbi:MAG: aminopeptidase [Marinilabiliales bacterium]|nr:MAG: aminopeptidase [Marinilabiliales bacterium]
MKSFVSFIFIILTSYYSVAQDVEYARSCLNKLSSKSFHGRGYVKKGDLKAAKFIAGEFKKHKLESFGEDYFQNYQFPINSFPGKISVEISDKKLIPGIDYVISCSNSSVDGEYKLHYLPEHINNDSLFADYYSKHDFTINEILVVKAKLRKFYGKYIDGIAGVILLSDKKQWWHVSNGNYTNNTIWIKAKTTAFDAKPKHIKIKFKNEFFEKYPTQNVVAFLKGSKYPEKYFVFTAHYDHLGMMGNKTYFPGANDNASGTSMLLDLARHFSLPENQSEYSIVFIAVSGEESGLHGSRYFADNPMFPLENIELLVNLDMVGSGSNGITVVNSAIYPDLLEKMRDINEKHSYLKQIKKRGESCNSDHCPFYKKGVKAVFIYTMGDELKEYHSVDDTAENFPFTAYDGLFKLLVQLTLN